MGYFNKVKKAQKGAKLGSYESQQIPMVGTDDVIYGREDVYPYRAEKPIEGERGTLDTAKAGRMLDNTLQSMGGSDVAKYVGELIGRGIVPNDKLPELIDLLQLHTTGTYAGDPLYPKSLPTNAYDMNNENDAQISKYDEDKLQEVGGMWGKYGAIDEINSTLGLPKNQESIMTGRATMDELNRLVNLGGSEEAYNKYIQEASDINLGKGRGSESIKSKINTDTDDVMSGFRSREAMNKQAKAKEMAEFEKMYNKAANPQYNNSKTAIFNSTQMSDAEKLEALRQYEYEQLANEYAIRPKAEKKVEVKSTDKNTVKKDKTNVTKSTIEKPDTKMKDAKIKKLMYKKAEGGKVKIYAEGGKLASNKVVDLWNSQDEYTKSNSTFKVNGETFTVKK